MTTTISWTPQDTRSSKNVQQGKRFSNFVYRNSEEKILFNQTRNSESIVVRARTHLNYFTKCLENNIQKKKKNRYYFGTFYYCFCYDIKESLSQLDQKTITKKMSICITYFKLKVIELVENIAIRKYKLGNMTGNN